MPLFSAILRVLCGGIPLSIQCNISSLPEIHVIPQGRLGRIAGTRRRGVLNHLLLGECQSNRHRHNSKDNADKAAHLGFHSEKEGQFRKRAQRWSKEEQNEVGRGQVSKKTTHYQKSEQTDQSKSQK